MSFACTLDGAPSTTCSSPITFSALADGSHTLSVVALDGAGNTSAANSYAWTVQTSNLSVTMTAPAPDAISTSTQITVTWTASTGFTTYNVYRRIGLNGTPYRSCGPRNTHYIATGSPGTTNCFQVGGVVPGGAIVLSDERCVALPFDDRSPSIVYSGTISPASATRAYQGTLSVLDAAGERATISAVTRKVSVLMQANSASGFAGIYVDGALVATVDLYSRRVRDAVAAYTATLPYGLHEVAVAWTGARNAASSGTAISLDGIALIASSRPRAKYGAPLARSGDLNRDGEQLEPADHVAGRRGSPASSRPRRQPDERRDLLLELDPREWRAQAEVDPGAEPEVRVRRARHVEAVGLGERARRRGWPSRAGAPPAPPPRTGSPPISVSANAVRWKSWSGVSNRSSSSTAHGNERRIGDAAAPIARGARGAPARRCRARSPSPRARR